MNKPRSKKSSDNSDFLLQVACLNLYIISFLLSIFVQDLIKILNLSWLFWFPIFKIQNSAGSVNWKMHSIIKKSKLGLQICAILGYLQLLLKITRFSGTKNIHSRRWANIIMIIKAVIQIVQSPAVWSYSY